MPEDAVDLTPDTAGLIAFARTMQRQAELGSADAATARKILIECGVNPDQPIDD